MVIKGLTAKEKILISAREVFAEKGYEGASISEIAKRAKVNKALVFYYFENKENLFKEIIRFGAKETLERKEVFMRNTNPFAKESIEEYYELVLNTLQSRKEFVKIVLVETLKGTNENTALFEYMAPILNGMMAHLNKAGIEVEDPQRLLTTEMFFDAIPLFMFAVLSEKWALYNKMDETKVKEDFDSAFKGIYLDYLYRKYFKTKDT